MKIFEQLWKRNKSDRNSSNVEVYCNSVGNKALAGVDIILGIASVVIAAKRIFSDDRGDNSNNKKR